MLSRVVFMVLAICGLSEANLFGASFQIDHPIEDSARVFFASKDEIVFRLSTRLDLQSLSALKSGESAPISALEISIDAAGRIQKFAVFRFSDVEVYEVKKEEDRLKFVRFEGASALFTGPMSTYRSSGISTKDALSFMSQESEAGISQDNLRVLRVLKIIDSKKSVAQSKPVNTRTEFLELLDADIAEMGSEQNSTSPTPSSEASIPADSDRN